ncbi:MAG: flagellar hook-associated protein FlgL [Nevskia sp.]|nr:flagellar hook-associated protein FlgL [Nevskia sp.]
MMRVASSTFYQQAVDTIDRNQTALSTVQAQMSSGLRVQTAADDPVAAGQILGVNQSIADTARWQSNAATLQSSLALEDSTLSNVNSLLGQVQSLALQANNGTLGATDRQAIARQMQQQLDSLVQQANLQDAGGRYLFGGTADGSAPFAQTAAGVTYSGNSGLRMIPVGPTSEIAAGDPGDSVFMQGRSGDGSISVAAALTNTGTASVGTAQLGNPAQWDGGAYTIRFSGGQYQVLDSGSNVIASGAYADGNAIQFRGLSVSLTGTPADGDSFSVGPSKAQSVFTTVQNLINVVANPGSTAAARAQNQTVFYDALGALGAAQDHINSVLAGVGSREQAVSNVTSQLQARTTQLKSTLSGLQDLDYAAATTEFSRAQTTLQAAEQSYVQIQGLSLFNYIK